MNEFPKREKFFMPLMQALTELGGSGSNEEINDKVISIMNIPEQLLNQNHGNSSQTEFEYQLAWVRTMLKNQGLIINSQRGIWSLINNTNSFNLPNISKAIENEINEEFAEAENCRADR